MAICPSTSVERQSRRKFVVNPALFCTLLVLGAASLAQAGTLITLTNGTEINGKLSLTGTTIHAEAESSPPDTALPDVLESRFDDTPFTLQVIRPGAINQLPAPWAGQNLGDVLTPGDVAVQSGTFTLTATTTNKKTHDREDCLYFVGLPWLQSGFFTAHLLSIDPPARELTGGISFRDSLNPQADMSSVFVDGIGEIETQFRRDTGRSHGHERSTGNPPLWLRLERYGQTVYTSISSDGTNWDSISACNLNPFGNPLVGLLARSVSDKVTGKVTFDQLSITPLPSTAQVLPAGVLLQGGSLLAGQIAHLNLDPASPDANGEIVRRNAKHLPVSRSAIAAAVLLPIERSQVTQMASKPVVLMRNGDMMDGQVTQMSDDEIDVSSLLLGTTSYRDIEVRACFLAPLQVKAAAYEVRLRDGSILNATALTVNGDQVVISDASGLSIPVGQDEIAQIRAGSALVQKLAELDWKATAPANAPANPAPQPAPPLVDSWLGPDQEQILETGLGTSIDFPLPGKFRALGVQIALASDSPPNATVIIHILADGHEVAKSPPFHAGDPPRFLELSFLNPAHLTLQAESASADLKVLYLDPVALRQ